MVDKFGSGSATFTVQVAWQLQDKDEHRDDEDMEDDDSEIVSVLSNWVEDAYDREVEGIGPESNRIYDITRWQVSEGEVSQEVWAAIAKALRYVSTDAYFDLDERNQFKQVLSAIEMKIIG